MLSLRGRLAVNFCFRSDLAQLIVILLRHRLHAIPRQGRRLSQIYFSDINVLCLVKHMLRNGDLCLRPFVITATLICRVTLKMRNQAHAVDLQATENLELQR